MRIPIYFDYMSTTPVDPRVKAKMAESLTIEGNFGNAASSSHSYGAMAKDVIELARAQVADFMGAEVEDIIWTSCATESNNLALKGAVEIYSRKGKHIITCASEHKSVLEPCRYLESHGFEVSYLMPEKDGLLDLNKLAAAIRPDTILVSVMYVNNEIGVVQDIKAISELVKPKGIIFHVDAVQAPGKITVDVTDLGIDLMSFSAHKVYGPKGIGALYIRHKPHRVRIMPQLHGGGQEFGLRSGTLATHQIVGMGEAFNIAKQEQESESTRIRTLRDKLWAALKTLDGIQLNGSMQNRVANNLNISVTGVRGEDLVAELPDLAISTTAACVTITTQPSHVLKAIGVSNALAFSTMRLSLGRFTTVEEIDYAIEYIQQGIAKLRGSQ